MTVRIKRDSIIISKRYGYNSVLLRPYIFWRQFGKYCIIRVEFPSELMWAIDPLLQYVKGYHP